MLDITITPEGVDIKVIGGQGPSCRKESEPFIEAMKKRLVEMGLDPDKVMTDTERPEMRQQPLRQAASQKGASNLG
jgi:hypothetical protein